MNFCSACGGKIRHQIPADDNRMRAVCLSCNTVHYENPRIIVGTLPTWQGQVLLCRRAIEPRANFWTLPAGFMELHETTEEGAVRETTEESGAEIRLGGLFAVFDIPWAEQVHLFFRAEMVHPGLNPGPESLEARLFAREDIPWSDLAFRSVRHALEFHFQDLDQAQSSLHTMALLPEQR